MSNVNALAMGDIVSWQGPTAPEVVQDDPNDTAPPAVYSGAVAGAEARPTIEERLARATHFTDTLAEQLAAIEPADERGEAVADLMVRTS